MVLWKVAAKKKKICLLGDPAVGKTSLIGRYVLDMFDDKYLSTIGTKVTKKNVLIEDEKKGLRIDLALMIWDIVGQKEYKKLHQMYYQNASGAIAVCDLTRRETLASLESWVESIFEVNGPIPIVFLGNKADLQEKITITQDDLQKIADKYNTKSFITSAKTGLNVENAFQTIARLVC